MKVFVTGATGLLGGATVRALVRAGHEVIGLTSRDAGRAAVEALGARAVVGDMGDAKAWGEAVRSCDAVIHAATAMPDKIRMSQADVDAFMSTDIGAVDALASCLGPSCKAFVVTSGAYVYGDTGKTPASETASTEHPHRVMEKKVAMEAKLRAMAKERRVPAMIVRPGLVYGDGGLWRKLYLREMLQKKRAMLPWGGQHVSFVHADDVGDAYRVLVEKPAIGETFNVADSAPETLGTVVRFQAESLGAPSPMAAPRWLLRLVAGDLGAAPTIADTLISNAKLLAHGWTPTYPSYREGIAALSSSLRPRASS